MQGVNLAFVQLQGAVIGGVKLQAANLAGAEIQGVRCGEDDSISFEHHMRRSIDQESDLSWVTFEGGLTSLKEVDCFVESLSDDEATRLREKLKSHIGKPEALNCRKTAVSLQDRTQRMKP